MAARASMTLEELRERALELSSHERLELAEDLLESVDDEDPAEVEAAWAHEIKRRVEDVESGRAELIPGEVVFARAQARVEQIANARVRAAR